MGEANILARLDGLEALLAGVGEVVDDVSPAGVLDVIERVEVLSRRVAALRANLLARTQDGGLWAVDGARTFAAWMSHQVGSDPSEVRKTVREARGLRDHMPKMAKAVADGQVSWRHGAAAVRHATGSQLQRQALAHPEIGEDFLVGRAKALSASQFRYLVRVWGHRADPQVGDARWQENANDEYVVLAKTLDGYHLQGWLSEINGKVVADAINAAIGVPAEGDERTTQQRNAQGLTDIAQTVLNSGTQLASAAVRPHLSVTVEYETLQRLLNTNPGHGHGGHASANGRASANGADGGVGLFDVANPVDLTREPALSDGATLTGRQLAFLTCDSEVTRIVFGPRSELLDVGRAKRTVSGQLRKAVLARDRSCRFPGCEAATYTLEVHHIQHWADGGVTSAANSIVLCRYHHQHVHQRGIWITRKPGQWAFYKPDGQQIGPRGQTRPTQPGEPPDATNRPAEPDEPGQSGEPSEDEQSCQPQLVTTGPDPG